MKRRFSRCRLADGTAPSQEELEKASMINAVFIAGKSVHDLLPKSLVTEKPPWLFSSTLEGLKKQNRGVRGHLTEIVSTKWDPCAVDELQIQRSIRTRLGVELDEAVFVKRTELCDKCRPSRCK